jgi:rare lipoprotein A (peptidoglycan hydrolase)
MRYPKRALVVALIAAGIPAIPATSVASRHVCSKTFTLRMFRRALYVTYGGSRLPHKGAYERLWRYARCQRWPSSESRARAVWGREVAAWARRRDPPATPQDTILASWYTDGGATASGLHYTYGFASCGATQQLCVSWGTRVEFFYHGRSVIAQADDHGPYAGSRGVDLNQNTASALGFDGVDVVGYRIL